MPILTSIAVLIPIVILGYLSRKLKIISKTNSISLNSFVYYIALPTLFIAEISKLDFNKININTLLGAVLPIILLLIILLILKIFKIIKKDTYILLSLSISFTSTAFFGIPFFQVYAGHPGLQFAILISSILGPIGIILSIIFFEYATKKGKATNYIRKIILNPLVLSIFIGIFFSLIKFNDNFIIESFNLIGMTAGPVAIFMLGIFIHDNFSLAVFKKSFLFSLLRLIFYPLSAFLIIYLLGIKGDIKEYLILLTGIPAAISLAVFAQRYKYKVNYISNIVVITTVASFFLLTILSIII